MNSDSENLASRWDELIVLLSPVLAALGPAGLKAFQATSPSGAGFLNLELAEQKAWWQLRCLQRIREACPIKQQIYWIWLGLDDPSSYRAFEFLRQRHEPYEQAKWLAAWLDLESLFAFVLVGGPLRRQALNGFDATFRHGELARGQVVKNRGLGLTEPLLKVTPDMDAQQIKRQFRLHLHQVHPDHGGSDAQTIAILEAYQRLVQQFK